MAELEIMYTFNHLAPMRDNNDFTPLSQYVMLCGATKIPYAEWGYVESILHLSPEEIHITCKDCIEILPVYLLSK